MEKLEIEKDYIDFMTDMGYSSNFLENVSMALSNPEYRDIPLYTFYQLWLKRNKFEKELESPYNFGTVIGELYVGLVFAKENWINLLPDIEFANIDDSYGIKTTNFDYPLNPNPKLRNVVRRIRNSLSHSNFTISLPEVKTYPNLFNESTVHFKDVNFKNQEDIFSINLTVNQLKQFYIIFRDLAFKEILNKEGKEPGIIQWENIN